MARTFRDIRICKVGFLSSLHYLGYSREESNFEFYNHKNNVPNAKIIGKTDKSNWNGKIKVVVIEFKGSKFSTDEPVLNRLIPSRIAAYTTRKLQKCIE